MNLTITEAIQNKQRLLVTYNGAERIVEPHAYGVDKSGNYKLRAFQVGEEGAPEEHTGWRLFNEAAIAEIKPLPQAFEAQAEYKKEDRAFQEIIVQL